MSERIIISFRVGTSPENLASAVQRVIDLVESLSCRPAIEASLLRLVVDEALTNAMEHGNRWERSKYVYIDIDSGDSAVSVSIEDEGEGFDSRSACIRTSGFPTAPRGRGIRLITALCEAKWARRVNRLSQRFPVG